MEEIWINIDSYEGQYQVSNYGRVRSTFKNNGRGFTYRYKILKPFISNSGYHRVCLVNNKKNYYKSIHRLVIEAFLGKNDLYVNHINGIKTDNNIQNLEYCTRSENQKHAYKLGLQTPCDNGLKKAISI